MDKKEIIERIQFYISYVKNKYTSIWNKLDQERNKHLKDFPNWCYCPRYLINNVLFNNYYSKIHIESSQEIDKVSTLYSWKATKAIFFFDYTLTGNLIDTLKSNEIPFDILRRLPYWCNYIAFDTPIEFTDDEGGLINGFFVSLDYDEENKNEHLSITMDIELLGVQNLSHFLISFPEDNNLETAINEGYINFKKCKKTKLTIKEEEVEYLYKKVCKMARMLIPFILYICSEKPDITGKKSYTLQKEIKKTKKKSFKNHSEPDFWEVGFKIGKQIRQYEQSNNHTGAKMHPHLRKAHWHMFYAGPRSAKKREVRIKWIPNIIVNSDSDSEIKPTIYNT